MDDKRYAVLIDSDNISSKDTGLGFNFLLTFSLTASPFNLARPKLRVSGASLTSFIL